MQGCRSTIAHLFRHAGRLTCLGLLALAIESCGGGGGGSSTPPGATAPGAPTGITATAGNASATVSWTAPSDGGSAITGYTVTASPGGATASVGGGTTSATVSGLINGTSYTFTVYATNAAGNGPASSPSAAVTPQAGGTVSVTINPTRAAVATLTSASASASQVVTRQFTASVTGNANTAVTWAVDGTPGGSATTGTVSASGVYTPPVGTGAALGAHTVTATSQADTTKLASATIAVTDLTGVFTYHNDVARTGQNLQEYALNASTVSNAAAFGRLYSCAVDASVYAQPLYVANVPIGGGVHNVLYVATEGASVYAFDADDSSCHIYWTQMFATTVSAFNNPDTFDLPGPLGITGTPVISGNGPGGVMYLVASTQTGSGAPFVQTLHALRITDGTEIAAGVPIQATVSGTSQGRSTVIFDPHLQWQRPALLLQGTSVIIAFGSAGDLDPYNGWLMAYNATTLQQAAVFNSTPNGLYCSTASSFSTPCSRGAFWMSGSGPAADASGNVYVASANGVFDNLNSSLPLGTTGNDMANSLLKFNSALTLTDFFTPSIQANMGPTDDDLGSGGVVVLPDSMGSAAHPHLVVVPEKFGNLWLVDRDRMSHYSNGGADANVQTFATANFLWSTVAVWGNTLYVAPNASPLQAFAVSSAAIASSPSSQSLDTYAGYGPTPSISAQGSSNGIVWVLDNSQNASTEGGGTGTAGPAVLRAYDAANLATRLYTSTATSADTCGNAVKFTVPTVADGRVYVGGIGQITVYGLKP